MFRFSTKIKASICYVVIVSWVIVIILINKQPKTATSKKNNFVKMYLRVDRNNTLKKIYENIKLNGNDESCRQPNLSINAPEIMKFVKYVPPIDCTAIQQDWVICENITCRIKNAVKAQKGEIVCSFVDILRVSEYEIVDAKKIISNSAYTLENSDTVRVNCSTKTEKWASVLTGIRYDKKIWDSKKLDDHSSGNKINVLIFGFDSISRNTFIRKLPQTYKYLTEELGAHVLKGYNILGDGTPQALTPMFTGKTELELPDVRNRFPNASYVNVYPFIWKDFKASGYVTGYFEDCAGFGTYTYRLKGFKEQPTDHYMRPYYMASGKFWKEWPRHCAGSVARHQVFINQVKHFFNVYETVPKFLFAFHGELSHADYNMIGATDLDSVEFLKDLNRSGALNNTLLIFMSDHGSRFAAMRNTLQGKLEERLPFFSFVFPKWFKEVYTDAYSNFVDNLNTLTTPFDIYATLKNLLNMHDIKPADMNNRSLSLFSKISKKRSCQQAHIEPHWCACIKWIPLSINEPIVQQLAETLINTINDYTRPMGGECALLKVSAIFWVNQLTPNESLLKYKKAFDIDGFEPDLSDMMNEYAEIYQIKISTDPGAGLFEASVKYYLNTHFTEVNMSDISRINKYGSQADCIRDNFLHLRKYCYCIGNES